MPKGIYKRIKNGGFFGKKHSEDTKKKISNSGKGKHKYWLGKKLSEEHKRKMSKSLIGKVAWFKGLSSEMQPNWKGGLCPSPYPKQFNAELKLEIRERDNFECQLCGISEKQSIINYGRVLSINHINFDKNNCSKDNLNSLCCMCNSIVNGEREKWTKLFMEKLKIKI